jgi:MSHA biogenesis protein MshM
MYLQHFGLTRPPLGKNPATLWDDGSLESLKHRFNWLLESPGIGLLTGEPGVGKTAALRTLSEAMNPHRYQTIYLAETDVGRLDLYRGLALALGLEPAYRRAQLWRDLKQQITEMVDHKQLQLIWIIDEAQNLPPEFFRDFPAFLNFAFDSRDLITVWLVGHPALASLLDRVPYAALASRIQARVHLEPTIERDRFRNLVEHAFQEAGCTNSLIADSGMELLRQAARGIPRHAGNLLKRSLQIAAAKGIHHLPEEILQQAIEELR